MRIRYREAGGFTGLSRGVDVDTATLPGDEARRIAAMIEQAALEGASGESPRGARDLLGYEIVIEYETRRMVVRFDDATIPDRADALLAWLQERARPIPLKTPEEP